jgi:hypothetical protein
MMAWRFLPGCLVNLEELKLYHFWAKLATNLNNQRGLCPQAAKHAS